MCAFGAVGWFTVTGRGVAAGVGAVATVAGVATGCGVVITGCDVVTAGWLATVSALAMVKKDPTLTPASTHRVAAAGCRRLGRVRGRTGVPDAVARDAVAPDVVARRSCKRRIRSSRARSASVASLSMSSSSVIVSTLSGRCGSARARGAAFVLPRMRRAWRRDDLAARLRGRCRDRRRARRRRGARREAQDAQARSAEQHGGDEAHGDRARRCHCGASLHRWCPPVDPPGWRVHARDNRVGMKAWRARP